MRPYLTLRLVPASLGAHAGIAGHFTLMEFAEFKSVAYLESQTSCLFLDRREEIQVRDSKNRTGPAPTIPTLAWRAFVQGV